MISTKWMFINKLNDNGEVTRNKEILVYKGYEQEEVIDYGEIFTPIDMLGVNILLSYATFKGFKYYHMHVKSLVFNGIIEEDVYIEYREGFAKPK